MRACMDDGTLLSPQRPALALDSSILYRAVRGTAAASSTASSMAPKPKPVDSAAACTWGQPIPGKFLADDVVGQPASTTSSLEAAQAWCCTDTACGGVTYQSGQYVARRGTFPKRCDANCEGVRSWLNPSFAPPPAPTLSRSAPNGEIWATYSLPGTRMRHLDRDAYRHVLVPLLREAYSLTMHELAQNDGAETGGVEAKAQSWVVVENAAEMHPTHATLLADAGAALELPVCDRVDFKLYHLSPVLRNGWALVGELAKWVPISAPRIRSIAVIDTPAATGSSAGATAPPPIVLQLSGVRGEEISFGFVDTGTSTRTAAAATAASGVAVQGAGGEPLAIQYVTCVFGAEGTLTMTPTGCVDGPW